MKNQQLTLVELAPEKGETGERCSEATGSASVARRKLMHMIDAGCNPCGPGDIAQFACKRCGHESEWMRATVTEIRRGIPCPKCADSALPNDEAHPARPVGSNRKP